MPLLTNFNINLFLSFIFASSIFALFVAIILIRQVLSHDPGNSKMQEISQAILSGLMLILKDSLSPSPLLLLSLLFFFTSLTLNPS